MVKEKFYDPIFGDSILNAVQGIIGQSVREGFTKESIQKAHDRLGGISWLISTIRQGQKYGESWGTWYAIAIGNEMGQLRQLIDKDELREAMKQDIFKSIEERFNR